MHEPLRLSLRRIYVLPTGQGLAFALMVLVMLVGATNYSNSLGFMLAFLLISLALVSMLHAFRNLFGLVITPLTVEPVFAGDAALLPLVFENPQPGSRQAIVVRRGRDKRTTLPTLDRTTARITSGTSRVMIRLHAPHRGQWPVGRLVIETRYPLGLFRAWSVLDPATQFLVYPKPDGHRVLPDSAVENRAQGERHGSGQDDFDGLRNYVPGDPPRHLHWKAEARGQGLMAKVFHGGAAGDIELDWRHTHGTDTEQRLSQLARWLLDAARQGYRVGLRLPAAHHPPASGDAHLRVCLTALALH